MKTGDLVYILDRLAFYNAGLSPLNPSSLHTNNLLFFLATLNHQAQDEDNSFQTQDKYKSTSEGKTAMTRCNYFTQGYCVSGQSCSYSHETPPVNTPVHSSSIPRIPGAPRADRSSAASLLTWASLASKPCPHFEDGACINAETCPFQHDNSKESSAHARHQLIRVSYFTHTQAWCTTYAPSR